MQLSLLRVAALAVLVLKTSVLWAEEPVADPSFAWSDTLKTVDIKGYRERGREWLREVESVQLMAGKKTEKIRLDDQLVNTVQNQSRQLFGKTPGLSVWESDGSGMQIGVASRGLSPNRS